MKRVMHKSILVIMVLLMLCVWPFCLLRKSVELNSNMASSYGTTTQYIGSDTPYVQVFAAQTAKLEYFDFKFSHEQDISGLEGTFYITLLDGEDKFISQYEIGFDDIESYLWRVYVHEWLKKGETYKFCITVDDEYSNIFKPLYTLTEADHATGSVALYVGEEKAEGQGLARYCYGYPLNIKNVVCIWAFILAVGFAAYFCFAEENGIKLPVKIKGLWGKVWALLHKYQLVVLLAEMLGILFLTAMVCNNRSMSWDEAYSFMMVTRLSLEEMIHATALDMHPPLFYLVLRVFCTIFGKEFWGLKLMSVLINGCVMVLGITLVRKNWGAKAAVLFNLVVGLGPQFISNSIHIRMYVLALFFVMWSALLAYEIVQHEGKRNWILFVLSSLGGVYTHYFTVFPLILIYGYLLAALFLERRRECKNFIFCCIVTVVGYVPWLVIWIADSIKGIDAVLGHLPWLTTVLKSFAKESTGEAMNFSKVNFPDLFDWMYSTNIKSSVLMGVGMLAAGIIIFLLKAKEYGRKKGLFLGMCATNLLVSYVAIALLASTNKHFFDNRYIFSALAMIWLFVVILFADRGRLVSCFLFLNLTILVLSSYTIQRSKEQEKDAYIENTYATLEQLRGENTILYGFPTFHILYGAHLQEQEFVSLEEINWETWEQDHIYFINCGPWDVPENIKAQYQMHYVDCGRLDFQDGHNNVALYRIDLQK